jgi:hypothetical protein
MVTPPVREPIAGSNCAGAFLLRTIPRASGIDETLARACGKRPDGLERVGGWIEVQPGRYRYAVVEMWPSAATWTILNQTWSSATLRRLVD